MPRFLIEIQHEAERTACIRAIKVLHETGSHFLTNAEYGCLDGEHKAWIIVDVDDKSDAKMIVPRAYRAQARVVKLNKFSPEDLEELMSHHAQ
ncbi:MAG: hypothetical protein AB1483_05330 [Candidatus Zixiibacteriota bacterium]